jgi:hypothetical protein
MLKDVVATTSTSSTTVPVLLVPTNSTALATGTSTCSKDYARTSGMSTSTKLPIQVLASTQNSTVLVLVGLLPFVVLVLV